MIRLQGVEEGDSIQHTKKICRGISSCELLSSAPEGCRATHLYYRNANNCKPPNMAAAAYTGRTGTPVLTATFVEPAILLVDVVIFTRLCAVAKLPTTLEILLTITSTPLILHGLPPAPSSVLKESQTALSLLTSPTEPN
jgi:hypothetical protein